MMPVFPSRGWAEAAMTMLNADPESVAAGRGWTGDFGLVIEAEPGKLDEHFVAWVRPEEGPLRLRLASWRCMFGFTRNPSGCACEKS